MTVATVWSMLALAVAGIVLAGLYRAASERAFDAQLGVYLKTIVANMVPDGNVAGDSDAEGDLVRKPQGLGEPRFDLPFSGWYWTVIDHASNEVLFASPSLVGDMLQVGQGDRQEPDTSYFAIGPAEQEVRVRRLTVEINGNNYDIIVAAETDDFREDVRQFRRLVLLTMVILGAGLLGAIYLQVRVGLKPLKRLGGSLIEVRRGLAEKIDEDLPGELAPLAVELNALIHANREVVERSRTHVGNLAHALKTPLSVITNEARSTEGEFADKVGEQATLMSTQIQHHLERARMAAQRRVIGVSCELTPVLERMVSAMSKIYRDKDVAFDMPDTDELSDLRFRGEQQDLEEMVGNLLDNACKWADLEVQISVAAVSQEESARALFEICVEDDGPGLSEDQRLEAVKRGKRLDETVPGTGLGLSIVADLAGVYGGEFELSRSDKGGLKATLLLPSV
ncbi:MAG: histidine kinase [Rhodobacteraceae bacterium]|nr:histidine kinase [Paracoccaceae bacterium]